MIATGRFLAPVGLVLVSALALSACLSSSGSLRSRMRAWADAQGYVGAVATVRSDLRGIANGIRLSDLGGLRTECVGFSADVDQLYASLPAPDRSVTGDLNLAAATYFGPGAQLCYGLSSLSGRRFARFATDIRLGTSYLDRADRRVRAYGIG